MFLQELGKKSAYYHAGRSDSARADAHEAFLSNDIDVIVATNAFGMGVDKPDIRFIIHYAHPASVGSYYQEIGRGGRNGERCDCILLFSPYDRKVQEHFIFNATPSAEEVADYFDEIVGAAARDEELSVSRQTYESHNVELFEMEKAGILGRRPVMCGSASIYLALDVESARLLCSEAQREILARLDERLDLSRTGYAAEVDMNALSRSCFPEMDSFTLEQALLRMDAMGAIVFRPDNRSVCYDVRAGSVSDALRARIHESSSGRRAFKMKRLRAMIDYGSSGSCLRRYLLTSLGSDDTESKCGFCDNCL